MTRQELYLPGDCVGSFGALRQGKSMNAARLAFLHRMYYRMPVIANVDCGFGVRIRHIEDFLDARNTIIWWDETQATLDSRDFANNIRLSQELIYLGKDGNIVFYTSPHIDMVDKRLRAITTYYYVAEKRRGGADGLSTVTRFKYNGVSTVGRRGRFPLRHRLWGRLYQTLDKKVHLVWRDPDAAGVPTRGVKRGASAPEGRRPAPVARSSSVVGAWSEE